jgi:hypothetical protein
VVRQRLAQVVLVELGEHDLQQRHIRLFCRHGHRGQLYSSRNVFLSSALLLVLACAQLISFFQETSLCIGFLARNGNHYLLVPEEGALWGR